MISRVQKRHVMKTSLSSIILLTLFALCAHGGEVEKFIRETLAEQRTRSALESNSAAEVIDDAVKGQKMPELELPKESVFTSKDKERDARYYKYDKTGKLISVEYAARPEKNEYYAYDRQGNIIEKRMGDKVYKYTYDTGNQLKEMSSPEGKREYFYDRAGRLVSEKLNGEIDVEYKYGYLDKVIEVNRRGKITKFAYDGFGMLAQKTFHDGSTEVWVWDGLALIRRGSDIYVNEPHVSGGVPILSKTDEGVRYHEHDFLGTTLWSMDTKGNLVKDYQDTTIFGEGSIQKDRSARFTGKPYDEDLQAYVFPYRNYDATTARWTSSDPAGYPDGINNQYYAAIPTLNTDPLGMYIVQIVDINNSNNIVNSSSSLVIGNNGNVFNYSSSPLLSKNNSGELIISIQVSLNVMSSLKAASEYEIGSSVTYYPHNGGAGAMTLGIREVVTEHEKAHAAAFFAKKDDIISNFKTKINELSIDESASISEIKTKYEHSINYRYQIVTQNYSNYISISADEPTINALNSLVGWERQEDAKTWIKER